MKNKKRTQTEKILNWLKSGKKITPLQALNMFGCFRLGARIWELRKSGKKIKTDYVKKDGGRFAQYSLK